MNPNKMNPVKAEATGESIPFSYDGEEYVIPPSSEWSLDIIEAYEDGKVVKTVKTLLGDEQWAKFKSTPRTVADLGALFEAIQEATGVPS